MKRDTFTVNGKTYFAKALNGMLRRHDMSEAYYQKKQRTLLRLLGPEPAYIVLSEVKTAEDQAKHDARVAWQKRHEEVWFEKRPVYLCDRCGKRVAWAKSEQTGKTYLCEVEFQHRKGKYRHFFDYYFHEDRPHFKTCQS